jgi:hypothetical protein
MGYGLDSLGSICSSARFFPLHSGQNDSGAHPSSYPLGTKGVKRITRLQCQGQEMWSYISSPHVFMA